jgi:hypothetical protein
MPDDASGFSLILHYSPEMVAELAMGAEHPHEIAERYGVDPTDYELLASQEWFGRLVAQKRHEFHDQGMLFVAKAGMMAEALLTRLFQQSMAGAIPPPLTVEVAKQLTDIGRLKPQPLSTQPGAAGNGFQINIQVNGSDVIHSGPALVPAPSPAQSPPLAPPSAQTREPGGGDALAEPIPAPARATLAPPTMALDFAPPAPPTTISNLRVPDFDVRHPGQIGRPAYVPNAGPGAAAAFGGGTGSLSPPSSLGLPVKPA